MNENINRKSVFDKEPVMSDSISISISFCYLTGLSKFPKTVWVRLQNSFLFVAFLKMADFTFHIVVFYRS